MTSNHDVIRLASIYQRLMNEPALPSHVESFNHAQFQRALERLSGTDISMMVAAAKLIVGKPFSISTDNPECIARAWSLAKHIGASVEVVGKHEGLMQIILRPPTRRR